MSDVSRAGASTQQAARRLMWWLVVPVLALLAVLTVVQYQQRIQDVERSLSHRADERAQELQALARPAVDHISDLSRLLVLNWDDAPAVPPDMPAAFRPLRDPQQPQLIDGWVLDEASPAQRERFGQIWWGSIQGDVPTERWLQRAALFQRAARVVLERAPGFEGSFFVATERNVSWGYPFVSTPPMLQAMGVDSLRALDALRIDSFVRARDAMAAPGGLQPYWGPPYVSQLHGQLVQSHAAAVQVRGAYVGEVSVDYRLDALQTRAEVWQAPGTRVWVVSRQRQVLADGQAPLTPPSGSGRANQPVLVPLSQRLPVDGQQAWMDGLSSLKDAVLVRSPGWVLVAAAREGSPWLYVEAVPAYQLRDEVLPSLLPNALLGAALLIVFVFGQWLFTRWFVTPALGVLGHLRELTADPAVPPPQLGWRWEGWIRAVRKAVLNQHAAREQLDRQREAMRQSEKLSVMGTLLAGVAHELNNPLAIVMGRAALLEDRVLATTDADSEGGRAVRDDTRRIREAAERCGRIVRTFLNMARQKPPVRRRVLLVDTVRSALDMLGHSLRSDAVRVDVSIPPDLPEVQADPDLLGQVLLNLMINAQQAMQQVDGERVLSISAGTELAARGAAGPPRRVWLRVEDTGPGIPTAMRDRLFEPFHTTKEAGTGTGLGLNVSRTIAREHGGDLVLEADAGPRTRFRLTLPLSGEASESGGAAMGKQGPVTADRASADESEAPEAGRVLLVEGEAEMAEITRGMLESLGWEVAQAESGAVALELLDAARFDAIVAAVALPDLDAAGLWRAVHERHPPLAQRLLFVTGDTLSSRSRQLGEATGCPSLDKPFGRADLQQALHSLLNGAEARPEPPPSA
jgi:signal transduction histidine kinase/CheY-like chemotaxis protein